MSSTLIRGGRLVDPASGIDAERDLLLRDGRVAAVEAPGKLKTAAKQEAAEVIDATGLVVAPGLVDIHVHLREPGQGYKETIATGTAAAAAGGFTSVCAMPNTIPVNDSPETTRWMQSPERGAKIRVFPIAAATRGSMGEKLTEYGSLKAAGAVAVTDDGKPILGEAIMHQALTVASRAGLPVIQHAEDTRLTGGCSMNAGALAFRMGLRGMPVEAESSLVERDLRLLANLNGARGHLHVAHLSTAAALEAVRKARRNGLHVTCEVAPHHFLLTEQEVGNYNTNAKMNPPLRAPADRDAMLQGILDGVVDCIATDHAPHAAHEKEQEFERAPNGITGLETALGLSLQLLHKANRLPIGRVINLLSTQPAAVLALKGRGTLAVGAFADVVIFDARKEWVFHAALSKSKSKNTPFDGWTMLGEVRWTISEGRIAYQSGPAT
ncbi:Dihydroorotase [Acidisarcina polymorpha]|uniref:Dihydroorotase n=1 Tax=Acidisarcina polymorpha TaxID=2211140 RepID=A0A2Z5FXG1_9BACT|nr:dihydroorotase [Acidisarcina polymorpha]AXC11420.1 Dihydroorotase [Acidisarcina polymorpha]